MMTPDDIDVWVGLDVGKSAHHAHALDRDGATLYDKPVRQDEKAIRSMLEHLSRRGRVLLVVDQPNTIGSLPLTVARDMGVAVAYLPGTGMAETIIPSIARDIKAIKDRRREVGRQVEKLLEDHPLLTVPASMPGIGVRTASSILLGIGGDIANFKSAAHLAAYAGIAPVTDQSGTSIKGERPARGGNKRLKNALWQSSFVASTKHPPSIAYYKRKREQGKHHQRRHHLPRPPTLRRDLQHAQKRRPLPGTSPRRLNRATREKTPDATGRAKHAHDNQPETKTPALQS